MFKQRVKRGGYIFLRLRHDDLPYFNLVGDPGPIFLTEHYITSGPPRTPHRLRRE